MQFRYNEFRYNEQRNFRLTCSLYRGLTVLRLHLSIQTNLQLLIFAVVNINIKRSFTRFLVEIFLAKNKILKKLKCLKVRIR
ncbi:hypothetical protein BpHYR1_026844 [Brachionus plicatilis]|uniref:Uncharacterized protein n=1 Tax=Brachionus plicatilis TaxID=10195 RepID=A0A3M7S756_BRAPC|nr:hypothetical protein BpHYR1_026844 [Brachionus plicatilis]